jgi:hypothetical protein
VLSVAYQPINEQQVKYKLDSRQFPLDRKMDASTLLQRGSEVNRTNQRETVNETGTVQSDIYGLAVVNRMRNVVESIQTGDRMRLSVVMCSFSRQASAYTNHKNVLHWTAESGVGRLHLGHVVKSLLN